MLIRALLLNGEMSQIIDLEVPMIPQLGWQVCIVDKIFVCGEVVIFAEEQEAGKPIANVRLVMYAMTKTSVPEPTVSPPTSPPAIKSSLFD